MSNTHPCPTCGRSILGNRWLCQTCWDRLPRTVQHAITARFDGTAQDYLVIEKAIEAHARDLRNIATIQPERTTTP